MDPRHLSRLQEEQMKAISETDVQIEQLEHFKQDYKSVQERLRTLPDKLTHDVMVPFGKLAFMPGRLTHTNEILVLLGDNWFVERSAKQAGDIVDRRIQELNKKLTDLKAQQKLLQPRLDFTSDLQAEIQGRGDVKEIIEEYDEAKEKLWDEQHRKNVNKLKEELKRNSKSQNLREKKDTQDSQEKKDTQDSQEKKEDRQKSDEELWSRLDELERQEIERGELRSLSDGEDNEDDDQENSEEKATTETPSHTARRVSWADKVKEDIQQESDESSDEYTDDDDDDDDDDADSEADDDDETRTTRKPGRKTIRFTHSKTPFVLPHQVSEVSDLTIHSPADIYKLYCPKSILKKTADEGDSDANKNTESSLSNSGKGFSAASNMENEPQNAGFAGSQLMKSSTSGTSKAFTGFVVEKLSNPPAAAAAATTTEISPSYATTTATSREPPAAKRVSKFKASRQQDTTS